MKIAPAGAWTRSFANAQEDVPSKSLARKAWLRSFANAQEDVPSESLAQILR